MKKSKRKRRVVTRLTAMLLACVLLFPGVFIMASADEADLKDDTLTEIAEQMQDKEIDPYDFVEDAGAFYYPESYDLRNVNGENLVTPVKSQEPLGTCWAFSAIAAAETNILSKPELRGNWTADTLNLSEKHAAWFAYEPVNDKSNPQYGEGLVYFGDQGGYGKLTSGGFPFYMTGLFASGIGPVMEPKNDTDYPEYNVFQYHGAQKLVICLDHDNKMVAYEENKVPAGVEKLVYDPFRDDWSIPSKWKYAQAFRLKESYILPRPSGKEGKDWEEAIGSIKEQIINKRPVEVNYLAEKSQPEDGAYYLNFENWAQYAYEDAGVNHGVTIVGWDDRYPKENFTHTVPGKTEEESKELTTPEGDGAWLVKNTWGSSEEEFPNHYLGWWGLSRGQDTYPFEKKADDSSHIGYFWMSYYDKSADRFEALDFDKVTDQNYVIYEHDYMPVMTAKSLLLSDKASMANVFTAESSSKIEEVSCQTTTPGTKVHYEVYLMNKDAQNPTDGVKVAEVDNSYEFGGYHKEALENPPVIGKGRKFSIVVTQTTPDGRYSFSTQLAENKHMIDEINKTREDPYKIYSYAVGVINKGESLLYADGIWKDLSDGKIQDTIKGDDALNYDMDNFPIKAYAVEMDEPLEIIPVEKINLTGISHKIAAGKKITLTASVLPKNASDRSLKWTSSNTKLATVSQSGKVTLKKGAAGKTVKITATAKDGSKKKAVWEIKVMKGSVKKITVKGYKKTLKVGKTMKLKAVVKTTKGKPVNKKLKWTSSNSKYATVTKTGKVKALKPGKGKTVTITVKSTDGSNKRVKKKIKIK